MAYVFRCNYDYIEISSFNEQGYKEQPRAKYCGKTTPPLYISTQSKLEIVFHSDVTTNAKGFLGHYEFLDKSKHGLIANVRIAYCQSQSLGFNNERITQTRCLSE